MNSAERTAFVSQLAALRKKRLILWSVFISYLPAISLALILAEGQAAAITVGILWLLAAGGAGVGVSFSRCPRCGQFFHMRGLTTSWSRRCQHCRLHLNSTPEDAEDVA
ncbi:hypothetical protein [Desulfuromonas thiophila]|uniref:hypothetical protein n=1 Tax=Desulfuromonas thiophila TaxID=57664 RepID=UPI0024A9FE87|nr:hypothetical protein [Desulfuromonas thiophila]